MRAGQHVLDYFCRPEGIEWSWPTWCNHKVARYFVPFWRSGAVSETCRCTHSQLKQQIHTCRRGSCTRLSRAPTNWWAPTRFLPRCASRWQSCHINFFPQSSGFNFHNRKKKISTFISAEIVISTKTVELSPKFICSMPLLAQKKKRFQNSRYSYSTWQSFVEKMLYLRRKPTT